MSKKASRVVAAASSGCAEIKQTFSEVARVLKPEGGLYLVDFGHLKSERSIN
jgi:ubiquinone/menaquinone biosynthesis C-methylase UbiE